MLDFPIDDEFSGVGVVERERERDSFFFSPFFSPTFFRFFFHDFFLRVGVWFFDR